MAKIWSLKFFPGFSFYTTSLNTMASVYASSPVEHPATHARSRRVVWWARRSGRVFLRNNSHTSGVAEKSGHADEEFLEKQVQLLGVLVEETHIGGGLFDLVNRHPPLDAAMECVLLVVGKIMARAAAHQDQDFLHRTAHAGFYGRLVGSGVRPVFQILHDPPAQLFRRSHDVRQAGVDHAARHAVELRGGGFLRDREAAFLLDLAQTLCAVGSHAREDHADRFLLPVEGEGAEEKIDGQALPAFRAGFEEVQHAVQDGHVLVRRDHIHAVRLHPRPVLHLHHLHGRAALEEFRHQPLAGGIQMLDDDKRHAAVFRNMRHELLQRLEASRRRTDADDGRGHCRFRGGGFLLNGRSGLLGGLLRPGGG